MRLERVNETTHPMYAQAMELYRSSFPRAERREMAAQARIMGRENYYFCLIWDEDVFVGIILYWEIDELVFVEHFCILPQMRNHQYGQRTLELMKTWGKTLILEIEPPCDEITSRRKAFYERCGFLENAHTHYQLPFHRDEAPLPLRIMTCPERITPQRYADFAAYLKEKVMQDAFD